MTATVFVSIFYLYLFVGTLFAIWFVAVGYARLDAGLHQASGWLRLLLLPGAMLLWPVLMGKMMRKGRWFDRGK